MKKFIFISLLLTSLYASADLQTTPYGKIVGIETRGSHMHVQTDFASGDKIGCPVTVGDTYMYDFDSRVQAEGANFVQSVILAAFMAGKDVSFHLYDCNSNNSRPVIGHVRVK